MSARDPRRYGSGHKTVHRIFSEQICVHGHGFWLAKPSGFVPIAISDQYNSQYNIRHQQFILLIMSLLIQVDINNYLNCLTLSLTSLGSRHTSPWKQKGRGVKWEF